MLVLAFLGAGGVLVFWKGTWALEQLEIIAGIQVHPSTSKPVVAAPEKPAEPATPVTAAAATTPQSQPLPVTTGPEVKSVAKDSTPVEKPAPASSEVALAKPVALPEPMDVNLTLSMIEDEKARQQLDEENQRKVESFLRRMDIQGVCHQGENSTALLDTVLVRPGDPVGDLGLTLRTIETRRLVFADRNGREYTKSY